MWFKTHRCNDGQVLSSTGSSQAALRRLQHDAILYRIPVPVVVVSLCRPTGGCDDDVERRD